MEFELNVCYCRHWHPQGPTQIGCLICDCPLWTPCMPWAPDYAVVLRIQAVTAAIMDGKPKQVAYVRSLQNALRLAQADQAKLVEEARGLSRRRRSLLAQILDRMLGRA